MVTGCCSFQVKSNIPLFDQNDHPFVPTCRLAKRRAQRQSRMPRESCGTGVAGAQRP
jgi:hypothetical protein